MKGRMVVWCADCRVWSPVREPTERAPYMNVCPRCGRWLRTWRCTRCGHEWTPRTPMRPSRVCPGCKSPYWNRERTLNRRRRYGGRDDRGRRLGRRRDMDGRKAAPAGDAMNEDVRVMVEAMAKARDALERATALTDLLPEGARGEWADALGSWRGTWDRLDSVVTEAFNSAMAAPGTPPMSASTVYSLEYRSDGVWAVGSDGTQRRVTGPVSPQEGM